MMIYKKLNSTYLSNPPLYAPNMLTYFAEKIAKRIPLIVKNINIKIRYIKQTLSVCRIFCQVYDKKKYYAALRTNFLG